MNAHVPSAHRFIRNVDTGLFLSPRGDWVADEAEAFDFPDVRTAIATYEKMDHARVEMVLIFDHDQPPRPSLHA